MAEEKSIQKKQEFEEHLTDLHKNYPNIGNVEIGDVYYIKHYGYAEITSFHIGSYDRGEEVFVTIKILGSDKTHTKPLRYFRASEGYYRLDREVGQTADEAIAEVNEQVMKALDDPTFLELETDSFNSDNSIIPVGTKKFYQDTAELLDQRKRRVELLTQLAEQKLNALSNIARDLQKTLTRVMKVVHVLELYLGVHEDIFQLQSGAPADVSEPISIRQKILFMDEEVAIVDYYEKREGALVTGIDYRSIGRFDEWLLEGNHIDQILPEKKGIMVLRPSRNHEKTGNVLMDLEIESGNLKAYILIRNGENLYRIYTGENMGDRFFPTLEEDTNIQGLLENESGFSRKEGEEARQAYARNMLIIQGLLDRTPIFLPLPQAIKLTDPNVYEKEINLIRDDESLLPDGRMSFSAWQEEINSKIGRGSRVIITGIPFQKNGWIDRFGGNYFNYAPSTPPRGLYTVEEQTEGSSIWSRSHRIKKYKILYMPTHDWIDRTRRIGFWLHKGDDFVLNYDMISIEDIDYYIQSRLERRRYLSIIPLLAEIRNQRLEEIKQEKMFVNLIVEDLQCSEEEVWEAVDWWKYKNIWKRPIREDDKKAWRMIRKRITTQKEG